MVGRVRRSRRIVGFFCGSLKEIGSWRIPLESGTCEGSRLDPGVVVRESLSSFGFDPFEIAIEVT